MNCNICNKTFSSHTNYFVHKREKHTFYNTKLLNCKGCLKDFNSVVQKIDFIQLQIRGFADDIRRAKALFS